MKENVLDVLMYLFEHCMDDDETETDTPDSEDLEIRLEEAGFHDTEIDRALGWLDRLVSQEPLMNRRHFDAAQRVYTPAEQDRLDVEARGFLLYMEQNGLLTAGTRELVIDRVMELDTDDIDLDQLKWVVLMVLFNQPDDAIAYARLEEMVMLESAPVLQQMRH